MMLFSTGLLSWRRRYDIFASAAACVLCVAGTQSQALAASTSGALDVRLQLEPGCELVFGAAAKNELLDFGRGDGISGSGAPDGAIRGMATIRISCSSSYVGANAPVLTLDAGLHARGSQRYLRGPANELVAYALYADVAHRLPLLPGATVQLSLPTAGSATPVPIYGEIPLLDAPAAGLYTDVVSLTLSY